jgi:hypothetical protein
MHLLKTNQELTKQPAARFSDARWDRKLKIRNDAALVDAAATTSFGPSATTKPWSSTCTTSGSKTICSH